MEEEQVFARALQLLKEAASKQESNEHYRVLFCALFSALKVIETENSILMFDYIQHLSEFIGKTVDKDNYNLQ